MKICLSKTEELDLSGRKVSTEMTHMDMPWNSQPRRARGQTEVLGGEGEVSLHSGLLEGLTGEVGQGSLSPASSEQRERVSVQPGATSPARTHPFSLEHRLILFFFS